MIEQDVKSAMGLIGSVEWIVLTCEGWTMIPLVRPPLAHLASKLRTGRMKSGPEWLYSSIMAHVGDTAAFVSQENLIAAAHAGPTRLCVKIDDAEQVNIPEDIPYHPVAFPRSHEPELYMPLLGASTSSN